MATGSPRPLTIGIVAGDVSGDQLGAHLMRSLLAKRRDLRFVGIGGSKMEAAGAELLFPMEQIAVRGYIEALRHYREIAGVRKRMRDRFLNEPPALFIGVDATEFNLDLEIDLKKAGIPTVQYAGPAVWASRRERVRKVRDAVSLLLTVFPFEARLYDKSGVPLRYVGHPLADLLSWWLLKRGAYLPYVGLPNILAGERIVPELLQDEATPSMLAAALLELMYDKTARANLDSRFDGMRSALRQNTEEKAAAAILPLLGRSRVR